MRRTSSSVICPPRLGATIAIILSLVRRTSCRASKLKSSAVASIQVSGRPIARSSRLSAAIRCW